MTMPTFAEVERELLHRAPLIRRSEVLVRPSPVPPMPGLYAWYFLEAPPAVPLESCHTRDGARLLYVGISPSRSYSASTLRSRIRSHLNGNASGSTLRLSLGCLLAEELDLRLRPVGKRLHFGVDEKRLNDWLEAHARVCWTPYPTPWDIEPTLIAALTVPLNLDCNPGNRFGPQLSALRSRAKARARPPAP